MRTVDLITKGCPLLFTLGTHIVWGAEGTQPPAETSITTVQQFQEACGKANPHPDCWNLSTFIKSLVDPTNPKLPEGLWVTLYKRGVTQQTCAMLANTDNVYAFPLNDIHGINEVGYNGDVPVLHDQEGSVYSHLKYPTNVPSGRFVEQNNVNNTQTLQTYFNNFPFEAGIHAFYRPSIDNGGLVPLSSLTSIALINYKFSGITLTEKEYIKPEKSDAKTYTINDASHLNVAQRLAQACLRETKRLDNLTGRQYLQQKGYPDDKTFLPMYPWDIRDLSDLENR